MLLSAVEWGGCHVSWTLLSNWAAAQGLLSGPVFVSDVIVDWLPAQLKRWRGCFLRNRLTRWTGTTPVHGNADQASQNSVGLETGCKRGGNFAYKKNQRDRKPSWWSFHLTAPLPRSPTQSISNTHDPACAGAVHAGRAGLCWMRWLQAPSVACLCRIFL